MNYPEQDNLSINENKESYNSGYRLIYKSIIEHGYIGFEKPYKRSEAWMWLILNAWGNPNKKGEIVIENKLFILNYGEIVYSLRFLAKAWGWTEKKVRTFLENLENLSMISRKLTQQMTHITICNFASYQNRGHSKGRTEGELRANRGHTEGTNTITIPLYHETTKNILSDSEKPNPTARVEYSKNFEAFWEILPSQMKVGKKNAYRHYRATVKNEKDYTDLKTALEKYKTCDRFKRGFVQNGSTWFNNWRDWLEYTESSDNGKETFQQRRERETMEQVKRVLGETENAK